MQKTFLTLLLTALATVALAAPPPFAIPEEPLWGEWQDTVIRIGNERDGFNDSVKGRICFTQPEACDGKTYMPYLAKAPDEDRILLLLGSCGRKPKYGYGVLLESNDSCETWHTPVPAGNRGIAGWGLTCAGNGVILATDALYRSEDNGATWQDLGGFPVNPRFGTPLAGWFPQAVDPKSNGKHLYKTLCFVRNYDFMESRMEPLISESFDAGKTWSIPRGIPEFAGASEVNLAYNAKGELVAGIRVSTIPAPSNDEFDRLETSISADGGITWSKPIVVAGNGRHHPSFALMPDGRMVMSYVVRNGYPDTDDGKYAYGIEAVVSTDGGHTWDTDHRYVLSYWTSDCMVTDEQGRTYQMDRWTAGPANTSTIYLPETGELATAYGTKQFCKRRIGNHTAPWQTGLIKWRLAESFSGIKDEPPEPVSAEEALRQVRTVAYWPMNYKAVNGLPDSGWRNAYPETATTIREGKWLRLDQRPTAAALFSARGTDSLEKIKGPIAFRMLVNIPEDNDSRPNRLMFNTVVGTGQGKYRIHFNLTRDCNVSGTTFGDVELPAAKTGKPFLMEIYSDPKSQCTRLWIDGVLQKELLQPVQYLAPETPAYLFFGCGSRSIGGVAEISELQFGQIR